MSKVCAVRMEVAINNYRGSLYSVSHKEHNLTYYRLRFSMDIQWRKKMILSGGG